MIIEVLVTGPSDYPTSQIFIRLRSLHGECGTISSYILMILTDIDDGDDRKPLACY